MQTLVLDQGYRPHRIVSWQRAVTMLFAGKVEVVEEYAEEIRSVRITIQMPAVVRLLRAVTGRARGLKLSRMNVAMRDGFRCQYCGVKHALRALTYDHVVPRSRGGRTTWENIVMACRACNERKAGRTPAEAGMRIAKTPVRPTWLPAVSIMFDPVSSIPDAWASFLYWHGTLDER